jgi:hypothetical protein
MTAYLLNILDLLFTLHALSHGGVELNPLMRSVPIMIVSKIFVVGAPSPAAQNLLTRATA